MQPFRCLLCGETYLGSTPSDRCPFCGAAGKWLVPAAEWIDYGQVVMSDQSREWCRQAVGFEVSNAAFYRQAASKAETIIAQANFKRLSKQELEHAELLCKMLGEPIPPLPFDDAPEKDEDKYKEAHAREARAIKFYLDVAAKAEEPRVKEVFRILAEIESEHLKLSNLYR